MLIEPHKYITAFKYHFQINLLLPYKAFWVEEMDNIINFPIRNIRGWDLIEETIRKILDEVGLPDEIGQVIKDEFKPIFINFSEKKFSFSCSIPQTVLPHDNKAIQNSINKMMEDVKKEFHETIGEAMLEIIKLIVEKHAIKYKDDY